MVVVAQLVEPQIVILVVAGSSPVDYPGFKKRFSIPSSRGLGLRPFTAATGVQIPLGSLYWTGTKVANWGGL